MLHPMHLIQGLQGLRLSFKKTELRSLVFLLCMSLSSLELAHVLAGSLENLENESKAELDYRTELDNYIVSHNITCCLKFGMMLRLMN
jgi:hypothetical protein